MFKKILRIVLILSVVILLTIIFKNEIFDFLNVTINSFKRTVLEEQRYKLILRGLLNTCIISISSIILGTIFALILFLLRKGKIKIFSYFSKVFVGIVQGIPVTVLLLIVYYVIFGSVDIEPLLVAVLTFSIYFSVYASEIFRGAMNSINNSQIQSAFALGFDKIQTLKYIIFPQALSYIIPVYKNEIVSLIKLTSIAGYISVMDLTKASDIIRNRTYEAFFPLILTAFIYYVLCLLTTKLLDVIYKKVNPRHFKRRIK